MSDAFTHKFNRGEDLGELFRLDIAVQSDRVFQVKAEAGATLTLQTEYLASPVEKQFPLMMDEDPWSDAWIIEEDSRIRGLIACGHNEWNRRLVIWHFYVDREVRRRGFGRQLMECPISTGREWGAKTAWAETSNVNYPGVIAYQRLGFRLCGFDTTLYRGTLSEGEFGLFLARDL